ncbi:hypothetical protein N7495_000848 [Penicillium taxi]|uniref:uncharacterized protein n=1 Tax=Penicillium taxi TaxID=168475 RepID=UPI002545762E|nr:uncharacterized protein N7495_000848 [Penicillium taxi]KAJ5908166.1 hypothetical protein N7495_000848 [Penicillium taxi]
MVQCTVCSVNLKLKAVGASKVDRPGLDREDDVSVRSSGPGYDNFKSTIFGTDIGLEGGFQSKLVQIKYGAMEVNVEFDYESFISII